MWGVILTSRDELVRIGRSPHAQIHAKVPPAKRLMFSRFGFFYANISLNDQNCIGYEATRKIFVSRILYGEKIFCAVNEVDDVILVV